MPNVTNVVREQVVTKASSKGFFRRIAEKIGLAQREVAECKGKSLSEMAEMTSKKDTVEISKPFREMTPVERQLKLYDDINALEKKRWDIKDKLSTLRKESSELYPKRGELEHQINQKKIALKEVSSKIEEAELELGHMHRDTGARGYSPDGDHIYGYRRAETEEEFKKRLTSAKDSKLSPLVRQQNKLYDELAVLEDNLKQIESAIEKNNTNYRSLATELEGIEQDQEQIRHKISILERRR